MIDLRALFNRFRRTPVLADENKLMPLYPSSQALLDPAVCMNHGRFQILPGGWRRMNGLHAGTIAGKGGPCPPSDWSDDPWFFSIAVQLFRLRQAYYTPHFGAVISGRGELMSRSAAHAFYLGKKVTKWPGWREIQQGMQRPSMLPELGKVIVTMPWGANSNYGHFTLDCLSGVASARRISELADYRFVFPPLTPWQRRHLELAGVSDPLELEQPVYRAEDIVFLSCMSTMHHPNTNFLWLRETQLANLDATSNAGARIYVSRGGSAKRTFVSEQRLESRLRDLGFAIVQPEEHSIDEQIAMFNQARLIVGTSGAALANVLYCEPGATVVEIQPTRMQNYGMWVATLCTLNGCRWRPYFCDSIASEPPVVAGRARTEIGFSFDVDLDDFVRYLAAVEAAN